MHFPSLDSRLARLVALTVAGASLLLAADAARADEVVLKSGKVRTGRLVSRDDRFVVLETRLGRIRIPASEVSEVRESADDTSADPGAEPATERPVMRRPQPAPAGGEPSGADSGDEPAPAPRDDAPPTVRGGSDEWTDGGAADAEETTNDRIRRLRAARVVRRTTDSEPATESGESAETPAEATIGGRVLGKVPKGTEVIVFQPPRPFAAAPGAIEIGKRTLAKMEMAGTASAWLTTGSEGAEQRIAVRLADVKRHVEVTTPDTRERLFEGINPGDWVRLVTHSGQAVQGRLEAIEAGVVQITAVDDQQAAARRSVAVEDIVTVDGVIRDSAAELALADIEPGELIAVTFWPSGDQVMGRHVEGPATSLSLDLDDDGKADRTVLRQGPIAEVRRIPSRHRELAQILRRGNVVRITYRDDVPEASIRQTTLGAVEALTAFALSVRDGDQATVIPFEGVSELTLIEDDPEQEVERWNARTPRSMLTGELPILPGVKAADAVNVRLPDGVSTLSDGRTITHVFVSAPYRSEVFGMRIGEPESQSTRRTSLRFDTKIIPRASPDRPPEPMQQISESLEGLRVVLLADDLGVVTGIEISRTE